MSILSGSFIQPDLYRAWSRDNWATEFAAMRRADMNHIVLQWVLNSTPAKMDAFYPTKISGFHRRGDCVSKCLAEAKNAGMTVWIGLVWTDDWWSKGTLDRAWLDTQFATMTSAATELWKLYGSAYGDQIAGFYVPLEVDNTLWATGQTRMAAEYKKLALTVHPWGKKTMCAPYYLTDQGLDAAGYAEMWGAMAASGVDVLAVQDGVGAGHATVDQVPAWFSAMAESLRQHSPSTALWADVETCTPQFTPAPLDRVWQQEAAVAPYVAGATTFAFCHYDSPQQGHEDLSDQWVEHAAA